MLFLPYVMQILPYAMQSLSYAIHIFSYSMQILPYAMQSLPYAMQVKLSILNFHFCFVCDSVYVSLIVLVYTWLNII